MTASRDFDRLTRAWLDLMPDEAPDRTITAVLQAVERTPQVRRPLAVAIWRPMHMNRFSLAALAAALVVVIAGGAYLLTSSRPPAVGAPSPSPAGLASPTPTTVASALRSAAAPTRMLGDWVADAEPLGLPNQGPRIQLSVNWDGGLDAWIQTNYQTFDRTFTSTSMAAPDGQYRLRTVAAGDGCQTGDIGTYAWTRSADGLFLTLTLVADQCSARSRALARTWVHTNSAVTDGGLGVLPAMNIEVTLPARKFGLAGPDLAGDVTTFDSSPFIGLMLNRDPIGFADPCSETGGDVRVADTTVAAVTAYLRGIRGYDLRKANDTIDGHAAVHVILSPRTDVACWAGDTALFGTADRSTTWSSPAGSAVSLWLTQIGSHVWAFWYRGDQITSADEATVIHSIHFLSKLPTP